jgi:hypothetical protein
MDAGPPVGKGSAGMLTVIERQFQTFHLLNGLVPLARDHDHVVVLGVRHREGDRPPAV